jgi:hypothetical protein
MIDDFCDWMSKHNNFLPKETKASELKLTFNLEKDNIVYQEKSKHSMFLCKPQIGAPRLNIITNPEGDRSIKRLELCSKINEYITQNINPDISANENFKMSDVSKILTYLRPGFDKPSDKKNHTVKLRSMIRKLLKNENYSLDELPSDAARNIQDQTIKMEEKMKQQLLYKKNKEENPLLEKPVESYISTTDSVSDTLFEDAFLELSVNNSHNLNYDFFMEPMKLPHMGNFDEKGREFFSLFLNHEIEFCYKLSNIFYDLSQASYEISSKKGNFVKMQENMYDLSGILISSKRLESNFSKLNIVLFTSAKPVLGGLNVFCNESQEGKYFYTNVLNYSYDEMVHKSEIFFNVLTLCYLFYLRGNPIQSLRIFFFKMFNILFLGGLFVKNLLSFSKYSNMVALSSFSKAQNLVNKYLGKTLIRRKIEYYYSRCIFRDFQNNIFMKDIIESKLLKTNTEEIDYSKIKFNYMNLSSSTIEGLIEISVFYTFVFKDTTNYFHDIQNFLKKTIIGNNQYLEREKELNGGSLTYRKFKKDLSSKFYISDVLAQSVRMFRDEKKNLDQFSELSDENLMQYLKKEIILNLESDYANLRKSMKRDTSGEPKKTTNLNNVQSYIQQNFDSKSVIDGIEVFNKVVEDVVSGKVKANELLLARKSQYEASREIYEQNFHGKMLTGVIQKIFKKFNKMEEREMVVESQKDKISLIRDSTKILSKKKKENEVIVFHNGDMSAWSGRDIYEKFVTLVDIMNDFNLIGPKIHALLKMCLIETAQSRIIIGKDITFLSEDVKKHLKKDEQSDSYYIEYKYSWAQGLYHNISSFVHALEQRFRQKFFSAYLKKRYGYILDEKNWFQVVHSDDKNEVILIPIEYVKDFVKFNTMVPRLFALEASETKDSFSLICSEMVGVQNIRGCIFNNGIKTISSIFSKCEDKSLVENYKYIVSRATSYFLLSNDIFGAQFIENINRRRMNKISGINEDLSLPVKYFGRHERDLISVIKYGNFSDMLCKSYINKFSFEAFLELCSDHNLYYRKFISPKLKKLLRKFKEDCIKFDYDYISLDRKDFQYVFNDMINVSLVTSKKEMHMTLDNLKYIRFMRYVKSSKYSLKLAVTEIKEMSDKLSIDPEIKNKLKDFIRSKEEGKFIPKKHEIKLKSLSETAEEVKPELETPNDIASFVKSLLKRDLGVNSNKPVVITQDISLSKQNSLDFYREFVDAYKYKFPVHPMSPFDQGGRSTYQLELKFDLSRFIDIKMVDLFVKGESDLIFRSLRNSLNYKKIVKSFNRLMNQYEVNSVKDYIEKRASIIEYLEVCRSSEPLVYTSMRDTTKIHKNIRFAETEKNEVGTDMFSDVSFQYFSNNIIMHESNPIIIIDKIKCALNDYQNLENFNITKSVTEILNDSDCSISTILRNTTDLNIRLIIENIKYSMKQNNLVTRFNINDSKCYFRKCYSSFDDNPQKEPLTAYYILQKNRVTAVMILFRGTCFLSNVKVIKFDEYCKIILRNTLKGFSKKFNKIELINQKILDEISENYNLIGLLSEDQYFLEKIEDDSFILINILKSLKNSIVFFKSHNKSYFKCLKEGEPTKRYLRYYEDATNYTDLFSTEINLRSDFVRKKISLVKDTETKKIYIDESKKEKLSMNFYNIKNSDEESSMITFYKKIISNLIFQLNKTRKVSKLYSNKIDHSNLTDYINGSQSIFNFTYLFESNLMIYSKDDLMIILTSDFLRSEEVINKIALSKGFNLSVDPKTNKILEFKTYLDFLKIGQSLVMNSNEVVNNFFVINYKDLTDLIKTEISNCKKEISSYDPDFSYMYKRGNIKDMKFRMSIDSFNDKQTVLNFSAYSEKIKRPIKSTMKFKTSRIYKDDNSETTVKKPNLKKFEIDYKNYSEKEFFMNSVVCVMLFDKLFFYTEEFIFKRISQSLSISLENFPIKKDDMMNMMINSETISIVNSMLEDIFLESNELKKVLTQVVYKKIKHYSDKKKKINKDINIFDIIGTIESVKLNKQQKEILIRSSSRSKIVIMIDKLKKLFKFMVDIGFDQSYLENYKNNEEI